MSEGKMREEFEAWAAREQVCSAGDLEFDHARNCYARLPVHIAWQAWQASRAALEIELPEPHDKHDSGEWMYWADQVDAAIEAAGVRVK